MGMITEKWEGIEHFKIYDFDHIEFLVGNAKQAVHFYRSIFGFQPYAYSGPETGNKEFVSYVLKNNKIYFVFTTPLSSKHHATKWLDKHGDGVYDIAFRVECDEKAHDSCVSRGAVSVISPTVTEDGSGKFGKSSIKAYGDTIHSFIWRSDYKGLWAPGFVELKSPDLPSDFPGLIKIDHIVANVEVDKMEYWKEYYENIFGFSAFVKFDETDISTEYSSLKSVVVRSKNWKVKLPINEPAEGLRKSQILYFFYGY